MMRRMRTSSVQDAVVIITGGARGIGATTAELFAARGATVWTGDIDQPGTGSPHDSVTDAHLDVTDPASWQRLVAQVLERNGRIDILVNNAGVMPVGPLATESEATIDLTLDVNVRGILNGMRAVLPTMVDQGSGHVVNVASMAGMIPIPGMVTYNASKFAALGASLGARREYAGTGVTVSAVLPSAVRTELVSGVRLGGGLPTVDPDDVARAILRTVGTRAARTSVPAWVAPAWALVEAVVPEFVEQAVRNLISDRRALTEVDTGDRASYLQRLERQAKTHAQELDSH